MKHEEECFEFDEYCNGPIQRYKDKDDDKEYYYIHLHENPAGKWFLEKRIHYCPFCGKRLQVG